MSLLVFAIVGCLLGSFYMAHLWRDAQRFVLTGRSSLRWSMLLRISGLCLAFLVIARTGDRDLVAALVAFLITRTMVVWRLGRPGHA